MEPGHGDVVAQFIDVCGTDEKTARATLASVDFDLQRAIDRFLTGDTPASQQASLPPARVALPPSQPAHHSALITADEQLARELQRQEQEALEAQAAEQKAVELRARLQAMDSADTERSTAARVAAQAEQAAELQRERECERARERARRERAPRDAQLQKQALAKAQAELAPAPAPAPGV